MSDPIVETVKARTDIGEIIGEHVQLRRTGRTLRGPCPLHGGEGPNFSVDPERGMFKCYVCQEAGDVFSFLMKHLGLEFTEALRMLGARAGIEIREKQRRADPHAHLREALGFAAEWHRRQLDEPGGEAARDYLESRGYTLEEATSFGIGCFPSKWDGFLTAARTHGIEEDVLLELGLAARGKTGDVYDRFRNRLTFEIQDVGGRPIGFGGRLLVAREGVPKYVNSPESPVFRKGSELYGLNWARGPIRRKGRALLGEGFTDVISLHRAGFNEAVAGLGTSFTPRQAVLLARMTKEVLLLYDSDSAGLRATFRAADIMLGAGIHPSVVTLPGGHDPDSFLSEHGDDAMADLIRDALDVLEQKLRLLTEKGYLSDAGKRRQGLDRLLGTLRSAADPALRDLYIDRVAEVLGIRRQVVIEEVAKQRLATVAGGPGRSQGPGGGDSPGSGASKHGGRPSAAETQSVRAEEIAERDVLALMVSSPGLVRRAAREGLEPGHFAGPAARSVFEELLRAADEGDEPDFADLAPEAHEVVQSVQEAELDLNNAEAAFADSVSTLRSAPARRRIAELERALTLASGDEARALLVRLSEARAAMRGSARPSPFARSGG